MLVEGQLVQGGTWEQLCDLDLFLITENCAMCYIPRKCAHCHWIKFNPGNLKIELFYYFSQSKNLLKILLVGLGLYNLNL